MCPKILASLEGETLARDFSLLADDIFSCLFLLSLSLFMANREKGAFHIYTLMMKNFSTIMIRKKMVQKKEEGQKIRRKKIHLALSLWLPFPLSRNFGFPFRLTPLRKETPFSFSLYSTVVQNSRMLGHLITSLQI